MRRVLFLASNHNGATDNILQDLKPRELFHFEVKLTAKKTVFLEPDIETLMILPRTKRYQLI